MREIFSGNTYTLSLLTPSGTVFRGEVVSVVLPGVSGKLGVLAGHMPLLSLLRCGSLVCRERGGGWLQFEIGEGVLDVTPDSVEIMTDHVEKVPISLAPRF